MTQQDNNYKLIEDTLLKGTDMLIEKAESQSEKALYNLFKSAILKKHKDQYDADVQQGEVKKETVYKSIDFLFEDACAKFRVLPNVSSDAKECVVRRAQTFLETFKPQAIQLLSDKGIRVV